MQKSAYLEKSKVYKGFHYSVLKPEMMEYLHKRTLEMFKEVVHILDGNGIKYMICGGTLLGANTIQKFIPWDDDLDVCIFEEDYERAADLLMHNMSKESVLQCIKTDPNYYLGWMKIRDKKSHVFPDAPKFKENGVWIDIYKLVRVKKKEVPYIIAKENIDYLNRRLLVNGLTQKEYDQRIKDGKLIEKLNESIKGSTEIVDDSEVYVIWSASKITINKEWIFPLRKLKFEDMEVTTFKKSEEYLKQHYGENYMYFPLDELRRIGICQIEIF